MRGRFFMRLAGGLVLMFFFSVCACTIGLYLLAGVLGNVSLPVGGALAIVILLGGAGLFIAARIVRRVASPIGELLEAAERVAQGDYSARVAERGPREIRALAGAFNSMAARLQAHDEQRRELLADVTHELRTPLTVAQGNLEGLLDGVYPRDDAHLETILEETRVLSRLIDDLRMLALAESGALKLQKEPTDIAALAGDAVAAFRAQADAAGIELGVDAGMDLPPIDVDPARMREVLANLIANALRYTPRGGQVRVACAAHERHVTLSVSDTGAGISPDDLPHIFDRFYKTQDSRGSGLGLAIAKNLVEAHGGEIHAESQVGRGTTIRVRLALG
jgi:signal transduction histidine kinase